MTLVGSWTEFCIPDILTEVSLQFFTFLPVRSLDHTLTLQSVEVTM
jgi:hypothetical protein